MRLAKIVATLGPGSQNPEIIRQLIEAGVNVFRLNFSHGQNETLRDVIQSIREISAEIRLPIGILADLQGPKFRVGELENHQPVLLEVGKTLLFSAENKPGNVNHLTTPNTEIIEALEVGDEVLLNDGALSLDVIERLSAVEIRCKITQGGFLGEKKGINVPGRKMANVAALTEKDKVDAQFALQNDVDFLALSFVRSHHDIEYLRAFINSHLPYGFRPPLIIAKIEKPQALEEIDAIIESVDGLMVARGDLGVEMKLEKVPFIQKMLIEKANLAEKPVITATQMLESMIHSPVPTRAEVSDVANAVFDGSDALMLSAETAVGEFPVETIRMMSRIIVESESHSEDWYHQSGGDIRAFLLDANTANGRKSLKFYQAIAQAACFAAEKSRAKAIVVLSYSGKMATRISKHKPNCPIIALTPHKKVFHALSVLRGIYPIKIIASDTAEETLITGEKAILERGLLQEKDPIVFCAGQTHLTELTNALKIYEFGDILHQLEEKASHEESIPPQPVSR